MIIDDRGGFKDDAGRQAVDVGRLGIDWARQRARINERLDAEGAGRRLRPAWYGAAAAVLVAAIAIFVWWSGVPRVGDESPDQFFTEIDVISEEYVPAGLYVLNGYLDEQPDAEAVIEFMLPQEGDEEEL